MAPRGHSGGVASMAFEGGVPLETPMIRLLHLLLVWGACLGHAHAAAAPPEAQVLLDFKSSISDGGGDLANWSPADASPCNWSGVRCSAGAVTQLRLRDMNISGTVPIGLGEMLLLSVSWSRLLAKHGCHVQIVFSAA